MSKRLMASALGSMALAFVGVSEAAVAINPVVSYTVALPDISESNYLMDPVGDSVFFMTVIAGLPQFDPAMGTLQRITVDINAAFEQNIGLGADIVNDDSLPHSVEFFTAFTDLELIYNGLNYGNVVGQTALLDGLDCFGGGGEACQNYAQFSDTWAESEIGGVDISAYSDYVADHFIGTGEVSALELWYVAYEIGTIADNASDIFVIHEFLLPGGNTATDYNTFTINYEYTPVPIPAAAWLFGSALVGLRVFRRDGRRA
ncbi:MAG: hypothetical protein H6978_04590 [Gammaproteobacteria bacterium]|nr:hypothetical protein [Gammaproteobacteria bacterium]